MTYGDHVDNAIMRAGGAMRVDVSTTVFLNQPDAYEGGELTITTPFGEQQVKLPQGSAVVYPSSSLHRVEPVTWGERVVAVTWIQSVVRDPLKREVLADLGRIRGYLSRHLPDLPETDLAHRACSNLLRMWADP